MHHIPEHSRHLRPFPKVRRLNDEVAVIAGFQQGGLSARRRADILDLKQGPGLFGKVIARPIDLVVRDVKPAHHDGGTARAVLYFFQRVVVGKTAIQRMGDRLLPDAGGFLAIAALDLRGGVLEHAEEVDPALAVQGEDFIEVGDVKLAPFFADYQRPQ